MSFDMALRSALERIVTASGPGFGDWQWRLTILPFAFGGLGVYLAGDVLNYAFIASRLQSAALQTKLLRYVGIVSSGPTFDDALCVFNTAMEIDFLSIPSEAVALKLMKKMADIYFTRVTKDAKSFFSLSPRQMALWQSQREDHTSDWLRVVSISGLGQTMNGKTHRSVLCYRLGFSLVSASKPCLACSKVFTGDIYEDHVVSCVGIIGIKHRHNAVRDTLVDICFRSGISAGKEIDIGLGGGCDKALRHADMLLYSWDGVVDVANVASIWLRCSYWIWVPSLLLLLFKGIRGRRGYTAEANAKVFHGSRHRGTCSYSYFLVGLVLLLSKQWE
uniref:Uncharacterized protein n=1 Tax=Tanacetum cinerariifolium TaxID=118510 RepID=A0A699IS14_TANCI|nr:hypothetical protein [Tanacetum cinerariifolium]